MSSSVIIVTKALDAFTVDVMLDDNHTHNLAITEYPVEKGSEISDHAQIKPKRYALTGGNPNFEGDSYSAGRVQQAYASLLAVQEKRDPFSVVTGLTTLKDMLIESWEVSRDKETSDIFLFKANLKQVILVGTDSNSVKARPQSQGEQGQSGPTADPPTAEDKKGQDRFSQLVDHLPSLSSTQWEIIEDVGVSLIRANQAIKSEQAENQRRIDEKTAERVYSITGDSPISPDG